MIARIIIGFACALAASRVSSAVVTAPSAKDISQQINGFSDPSDQLSSYQSKPLSEAELNKIPSEEDRRFMLNDVAESDGISRESRLWPDKVVPYLVDNNIGYQDRQKIRRAMDNIAAKTCIRFKRRTNERDYVVIQRKRGRGCLSLVGKDRGPQYLNLESGYGSSSCMYVYTIMHELIHAIGFDHEQNRPDREQHVRILRQNIIPGMERNFQVKKGNPTFDLPYDFKSIMHYGNYDFSRNGQATIAQRRGAWIKFGGYEMTKLDARKINAMYKCSVKGG